MDVGDAIGGFGPFQWGVLAITSWRAVCGAFIWMTYQVMSFDVAFYCDEPNNQWNSSQCFTEDNSAEGNIVPCTTWLYNSTDHQSIVEEWDLVCERTWFVSFGYMAAALGNFLAYIPSGQLADKFGRKPLTILGTCLSLIIPLVSLFSTGPVVYAAFRFFIGLSYALAQNSLICLYIESVGREYRDTVVISYSGAWGLGVMGVAAVSYYVPKWRYIILISSLTLQLPMVILVTRYLDESTRWFLANKNYAQAKILILKHSKINRRIISDPDALILQLRNTIEKDEGQEQLNFLDLWTNRQFRKRFLILSISYCFLAFVYHGFLVSIGRLHNNLHLNLAVVGILEICVVPLYFFMVKYFDRKRSLMFCFILSGFTFLLTLAVPADLHWLTTTFSMVGRFFNALPFILLYLFVAELFPTNIRTVALSGTMAVGRIGIMLAPATDILGRKYGEAVLHGIYGTLSLLISVAFLMLPETKNKQLPDTAGDSEKLSEKNGTYDSLTKENLPERTEISTPI